MKHVWHDLLFLHWPVEPALLRNKIPPQVEIDTFGGSAWLGIIAFWMSGIRLRHLPPLPFASGFPELNVRTYVHHRGRPGVYFMSLDAPHRLLSWIARRWYHLAYVMADIAVRRDGDWFGFGCRRHGRNRAEFGVRYRPISRASRCAHGSQDEWLTERYRLYAGDQSGRLWKAEIAHMPWGLSPAEVQITRNTMAQSHGLPELIGEPIAHYGKMMETQVWAPELMDSRTTRA